MRDVYEFAKFFIKEDADTTPNTYDGNMKLQKLLVLANLAHIVEYNEPLFNEDILAFKNGCVVEKVRLRYKNSYRQFKEDSMMFEPDFTQKEYNTLRIILDVFGKASAKELSEINHTFMFWKDSYEKGTDSNGYHLKEQSIVDMKKFPEDLESFRNIILAYKESMADATGSELINGITFYYDGFELTDEIIDQLESFSLSASDDCYTVYLDDNDLVIY